MREMWDEELSQRTTLQCVRDAIVSSGPGRGVWTGKSQSCPRFVLCLGPDTVCIGISNSVGGRRIPSVDRAALRAASTELRSVDFGMDRAWVALQRENEAEYDDGFSRVLGCCEAWVRHVAVPNKFVDTTVRSISSAYLHVDDALYRKRRRQWEKNRESAYQYLIFYLRVSITLPYDQRCVVGGGGIELDDEGIATRATASILILRFVEYHCKRARQCLGWI